MSPRNQSPDVNEQSPLISPQIHAEPSENSDVEESRLSESFSYDVSGVESKSSWYLFLLTLSIGGLQIVWSVELSNGSPYLLSLGMSKSLLAFVWIAGPLSGAIVQPYVGIRSDNCRIAWGKRKPFMIGGGIVTVFALVALAWTREMVRGVLGLFGVAPESVGTKVVTIVFATIMMYVLDVAINTVQAGIRAFIVDNAPAHQQESANAWASGITGVGNVVGYVFGYIDLPKRFPFFGDTQFKVLCVIASIALSSTLLISCLTVKERDPRLESGPPLDNPGVFSFFQQVFSAIRRLPPQIRKICEVQFFSWIGWFPFLFYITTYIGQLYVDPHLKPDLPDNDLNHLWEEATRVGTFALLIYALVSFACNVLLPLFIVPSYKPISTDETNAALVPSSPVGIRRNSSMSIGHLPFSGSSTNLSVYIPPGRKEYGNAPPTWLSQALERIQIPGLTLRRAWLVSQVIFALCMASTFFIRTPAAATAMAAVVGIPWSLTIWAPFALISAEIAQREELNRRKHHRFGQRESAIGGTDPDLPKQGEEREGYVDQAGVILGLHNVAISTPQILATLISSVVFQTLQKPRGVPGDHSVAWVLRMGGVAALVAAAFIARMSEGGDAI